MDNADKPRGAIASVNGPIRVGDGCERICCTCKGDGDRGSDGDGTPDSNEAHVNSFSRAVAALGVRYPQADNASTLLWFTLAGKMRKHRAALSAKKLSAIPLHL